MLALDIVSDSGVECVCIRGAGSHKSRLDFGCLHFGRLQVVGSVL